jgi:hypothetical protein
VYCSVYSSPIHVPIDAQEPIILRAQVRTIAVRAVRVSEVSPDGGFVYVADPRFRSAVQAALRHHLGLDIPPLREGAPAGAGRL